MKKNIERKKKKKKGNSKAQSHKRKRERVKGPGGKERVKCFKRQHNQTWHLSIVPAELKTNFSCLCVSIAPATRRLFSGWPPSDLGHLPPPHCLFSPQHFFHLIYSAASPVSLFQGTTSQTHPPALFPGYHHPLLRIPTACSLSEKRCSPLPPPAYPPAGHSAQPRISRRNWGLRNRKRQKRASASSISIFSNRNQGKHAFYTSADDTRARWHTSEAYVEPKSGPGNDRDRAKTTKSATQPQLNSIPRQRARHGTAKGQSEEKTCSSRQLTASTLLLLVPPPSPIALFFCFLASLQPVYPFPFYLTFYLDLLFCRSLHHESGGLHRL